LTAVAAAAAVLVAAAGCSSCHKCGHGSLYNSNRCDTCPPAGAVVAPAGAPIVPAPPVSSGFGPTADAYYPSSVSNRPVYASPRSGCCQ
jgi:hypothetical protein